MTLPMPFIFKYGLLLFHHYEFSMMNVLGMPVWLWGLGSVWLFSNIKLLQLFLSDPKPPALLFGAHLINVLMSSSVLQNWEGWAPIQLSPFFFFFLIRTSCIQSSSAWDSPEFNIYLHQSLESHAPSLGCIDIQVLSGNPSRGFANVASAPMLAHSWPVSARHSEKFKYIFKYFLFYFHS